MTPQFAKSSSINNSARCNHRFPNGMRCRLIGFGTQPFCPKHTQPAAPFPPDPAEVASTLTANLDDFTFAAQINDFLSPLLRLLGRVANRLVEKFWVPHTRSWVCGFRVTFAATKEASAGLTPPCCLGVSCGHPLPTTHHPLSSNYL